MKVKGAEWNRFYFDDSYWKKDYWHEGSSIIVNGVEFEDEIDADLEGLKPDDDLEITDGVVYLDEDGKKWESLDTFFKKWRRKQTHETICIEVPKAKTLEIKDYLKKQGCKFAGCESSPLGLISR